MAGYIGQDVAEHFSEFQKQDLTGATGGTLTLSNSVNNANDIELYINHVRQEPTTSYSASGTTITLNGYTVAASDDIYVMYKKAIITHAPSSGSVGAGQIANGSVTGDKLSANLDLQNVTIKGGSTTAMTIDSTGRILTPARPSFLAHGATTTSSSAGYIGYPNITASKGGHNIGGHYNTSTSQFTAPYDGVYVFSFSVYANTTSSVDIYGVINNDTSTASGGFQVNSGSNDDSYPSVSGSIAIQLSATNTFGFYMTSGDYHTNTSGSFFSGYLLG